MRQRGSSSLPRSPRGKTQVPDAESGRAHWTLTGFSDVRILLNVRFRMIGPQILQKGQRTLDL